MRLAIWPPQAGCVSLPAMNVHPGSASRDPSRPSGPLVFLDMEKSAELIAGAGYNHFELLETLANPYGLTGRAMLAQMQLAK